MEKKIKQKARKYFAVEKKKKIIEEFFSRQCAKAEIWKKYTVEPQERGHLLRWMRQLGYETDIKTKRVNIASNSNKMIQKKPKPCKKVAITDESL